MKWGTLVRNTRMLPGGGAAIVARGNASNFVKLLNNPIYDPATKEITFLMKVRSERVFHNVTIQFTGVEPDQNVHPAEAQKRPWPKPSLSKNDIKVRCTCLGFRFTSYVPDARNHAFVGRRWPIHQSKSNRQSRNPNNRASCCKHIIAAQIFLLDNKLVVER